MGSFVQSDKFGDHTCCLGAEFSRRDVSRKRRSWGFVAEEWTEEVDEEKLEEHAAN